MDTTDTGAPTEAAAHRRVAADGDEAVRRVKPLARLVSKSPREVPDLRGSILYEGDILSPLGTWTLVTRDAALKPLGGAETIR